MTDDTNDTALRKAWTTPSVELLGDMDDTLASQEANDDGQLLGQNLAGS